MIPVRFELTPLENSTLNCRLRPLGHGTKKLHTSVDTCKRTEYGARTHDIWLRRPALYPTELKRH